MNLQKRELFKNKRGEYAGTFEVTASFELSSARPVTREACGHFLPLLREALSPDEYFIDCVLCYFHDKFYLTLIRRGPTELKDKPFDIIGFNWPDSRVHSENHPEYEEEFDHAFFQEFLREMAEGVRDALKAHPSFPLPFRVRWDDLEDPDLELEWVRPPAHNRRT